MSEKHEDGAYEDLVFECFFKLISHQGIRKPFAIPEGLEHLEGDEWIVLAYLQQISNERGLAIGRSSAAAHEERVEVADSDIGLQATKSGDNEGRQVPASHAQLEPPEDEVSGVSLVKAATRLPVEKDGQAALPEQVEISARAENSDSAENSARAENSDSAEGFNELSISTDPSDAQNASADELETEEGDSLIHGPGGIPKTGLEASSRSEPDRLNLKNGRAGQPYQSFIEGYSQMTLQDDGGAGLLVSAEGEVTSEGLAAGEYTVQLSALKAGRTVGIRARLSIIPDPRDLWKDIASDQSAPRAKVDEASAYCRTDEAFIVAASKRGRSHAQEGKYRDDDFSIRIDTETGWHILVVADGAGSAELSREGSRIACEVVMGALPALLAEKVDPYLHSMLAERAEESESRASKAGRELFYPVLPEAALKAARAIETEAVEAGLEAQAFSTTIVIAVSKRISGRWITAGFTVGDGGVAIFDAANGQVVVLCRPDSGEYAGQTRFLSCSEFEDENDVLGRIFTDLREDFTVLAAMTDGVTDPKFPTEAALENAETWSGFWADDIGREVDFTPENQKVEEQMLSWLDFWSRGNHDDRTIALMLPAGHDKGEKIEAAQVADKCVDEQMGEATEMQKPAIQDDDCP